MDVYGQMLEIVTHKKEEYEALHNKNSVDLNTALWEKLSFSQAFINEYTYCATPNGLIAIAGWFTVMYENKNQKLRFVGKKDVFSPIVEAYIRKEPLDVEAYVCCGIAQIISTTPYS